MWTKKNKEEEKPKIKIQDERLTQEAKDKFEKTLLSLNLELSRLRSLRAELEIKGEEKKKELESGVEDRDDVLLYLKRVIRERDEELNGLKKVKSTKEMKKSNTRENYINRITEQETILAEMTDKLSKEKSSLEYKLHTMLPLKNTRKKLLDLINIQETKLDDQKERHRWEIYDLEMKVILERHNIETSIEKHIQEFMDNLEKEKPLRVAARENNLIKSNICLNNSLVKQLDIFFQKNNLNISLDQKFKRLNEVNECKLLTVISLLKQCTLQRRNLVLLVREYELLESKPDNNFEDFYKELDNISNLVKLEKNTNGILKELACNLKTELFEMNKKLQEYEKYKFNIVTALRETAIICSNLLKDRFVSYLNLNNLRKIFVEYQNKIIQYEHIGLVKKDGQNLRLSQATQTVPLNRKGRLSDLLELSHVFTDSQIKYD